MTKSKKLGKKILSFLGAAVLAVSLLSGVDHASSMQTQAASRTMTASEITTNMGLGWNLGNSLDATGRGSSSNIKDFETYWGNPVVTQSLINTVKAKGFNTIRIPVSWYEHVSYNNGNYTIDTKWLARVKEVVDYAYNNNMYVILNIHHENWINRSDFASSYNAMSKELIPIWKQIATYFSNYDQRLIFEGMNEPRAAGTSIEWSGNEACYNVVNKLNDDFVRTVRSVTSPYQSTRLLMIPGYAASCSSSVYSYLTVPNDPYVAVSIHAYSPYEFTMGNGTHDTFTSAYQSSLDGVFKDISTYFVNKGIPVVIGEFSASNFNNTTARVNWAKYYMTWTKKLGIPCVLWDNNANTNGSDSGEAHGYLNRSTLKWYSGSETVVDTMLSVLRDSSIPWGGGVETKTYAHSSVDSVASSYVVTSGSLYIEEYCTDSYAINGTQLASGRELAVVYQGKGIPKMALVDGSWENWTEVAAYDVDLDRGIAYFSYDDIKSAWGTSTSSLKYVYVCGTGMTLKKIVSIPAATVTGNNNQGNTGNNNQGNTGNNNQGNTGNNNQGNTGNNNQGNTGNNTPVTGAQIQNGWYYIKNVNAQKYLQVENNTGKDGQNVVIGTGTGVDGQKWYVENQGDGYVTIKSATGYMLDVVGGGSDNGVNINIWSANGWDPQRFKIAITSVAGQYGILTKVSNDVRCLDVNGAKKADGTNVLQWVYSAKANQVWVFEPTEFGGNLNNTDNNNQGNTGNDQGNTGNNNQGNTGNDQGNTGNNNQGNAGNDQGNTGNNQGTTGGNRTSVPVTMTGSRIDLSAYQGRKIAAITFDMTAAGTGSGAAHLYTASNGWIDAADYSFNNEKSVTIDLSKYNGIGAIDLFMWWNSAGATITNVQVVLE